MSQIAQTELQIKQSMEVKGFDFASIAALLIPILIERLTGSCGKTETSEEKSKRIAAFVTTPTGKAQVYREIKRSKPSMPNGEAVALSQCLQDQLSQANIVRSLIDESDAADNWDCV